MFAFSKPLGSGAAGLLAAAVGFAVPLAASAGPAAAMTDTAIAAETASADAQIVVKDLDTGRLRAATAEEAQALHRGHAQLRGANRHQTEAKSHWSGAQGARLSDDFMNFSVVVKRADGSFVELCVEGPEATARVVKAAPQYTRPASLPTE